MFMRLEESMPIENKFTTKNNLQINATTQRYFARTRTRANFRFVMNTKPQQKQS